MRLNKNKSFHVVMLMLIISFISQPVLAASISTAMQIHVVDPAAAMTMPETGTLAEHSKECYKGKSHQNCLVQCIYCLAISFILPTHTDNITRQGSPVIHVVQTHRPSPVSHIPAHEPPQYL